MSDLGIRSGKMVSPYFYDADQALTMTTASEQARVSYRRKKVSPHALFLFLSVCINVFVSSVLLDNQKQEDLVKVVIPESLKCKNTYVAINKTSFTFPLLVLFLLSS